MASIRLLQRRQSLPFTPQPRFEETFYCNYCDREAATQAVQMTASRTLKLRLRLPLDTMLNALADYLRTL